MKFHTTKVAVKENYADVIAVGYCNIQYLLNRKTPVAYTTRIEGWGADIYPFEGTAIATGYAPFGNLKAPYELCREYDQMAEKIVHNYDISTEEQNRRIDILIERFINQVKEWKGTN
ncbi:hypothetical protein M2140_000098 [Clostridiales Family XIII bacterium PM5-7]